MIIKLMKVAHTNPPASNRNRAWTSLFWSWKRSQRRTSMRALENYTRGLWDSPLRWFFCLDIALNVQDIARIASSNSPIPSSLCREIWNSFKVRSKSKYTNGKMYCMNAISVIPVLREEIISLLLSFRGPSRHKQSLHS